MTCIRICIVKQLLMAVSKATHMITSTQRGLFLYYHKQRHETKYFLHGDGRSFSQEIPHLCAVLKNSPLDTFLHLLHPVNTFLHRFI